MKKIKKVLCKKKINLLIIENFIFFLLDNNDFDNLFLSQNYIISSVIMGGRDPEVNGP